MGGVGGELHRDAESASGGDDVCGDDDVLDLCVCSCVESVSACGKSISRPC